MARPQPVLLAALFSQLLACGGSSGGGEPASKSSALSSTYPRTPYWGSPLQLPGRVEAENYDNGGEGVAYHDTTPGNVFGVYRFDDVDVGAIPGGGYFVGYLAPGEWTTYSVNVPATSSYQLKVRAASAYSGPNTFHVELSGADVTGPVSAPYTGDWQAYTIITLPSIRLTAGQNQILRVVFDAGAWNFDYLDVQLDQPFGGTPWALPGRVEAENYDTGGEGVSWHDTTPGNVFGVYRFDDVDVGAIPGGGYFVGNIAVGEWVNYTVNINAAQNYDLHVHYASAYPYSTTFHVELDGQNISGTQTIGSTGDWNAYTIKSFPVGTLAAGNHLLRFAFDTGAWNFDWFELVSNVCVAPQITMQPPLRANAAPGGTLTLNADASGTPAPAFQWYKDGSALPTQTSKTLFLTGASEYTVGSYSVIASNRCGQQASTATVADVSCVANPGVETDSLNEVLNQRPALCNWRAEYLPGFPNALTTGSNNRPVVVAAIGFVKGVTNLMGPGGEPDGIVAWWRKYLSGELGGRTPQWYFGGLEAFSNTYEQWNTISIMAVRYRAHQLQLTDLEGSAGQWLRATFALQAAAATPQPLVFWDRGLVCNSPSLNTGPYLSMGGMRSAWTHWGEQDRSILYAYAVGEATNGVGESAELKKVRTFLEAKYPPDKLPGSNDGDIYGLDSTLRSGLLAIRTTGQLPSNYGQLIAGIKTARRYHIAAWSGVTVTLLEAGGNGDTSPTYGVAFFSAPRAAQGNEAWFLYPFNRGTDPSAPCVATSAAPFKQGIPEGQASLDLGLGSMTASTPGNAKNPPASVTITGLPASAPNYHLILGP
jgi:hypothetical protein